MTSFAYTHYPLQHPGVVRAERGLGGVAALAHSAVAYLRSGLRAWAAARRQTDEDAQYWNAALNDARIMADISRAMSAAATRDIRDYY
jgi:3-mercaptopyruvate sulfurtransferase SseA